MGHVHRPLPHNSMCYFLLPNEINVGVLQIKRITAASKRLINHTIHIGNILLINKFSKLLPLPFLYSISTYSPEFGKRKQLNNSEYKKNTSWPSPQLPSPNLWLQPYSQSSLWLHWHLQPPVWLSLLNQSTW